MPLSAQAFLSRVPLEIQAHLCCRMPRDTGYAPRWLRSGESPTIAHTLHTTKLRRRLTMMSRGTLSKKESLK